MYSFAILSAFLFGLLSIGLSYLAPYMGSRLIQISLSIFGTAGGPLMGLFALGIFFPFANSWVCGAHLISSRSDIWTSPSIIAAALCSLHKGMIHCGVVARWTLAVL